MTTQASAGTRPPLVTDFGKLGERLIRFGNALKDPNTTVAQLTALATSCGIALKLRAVAESGGVDE